MTTASGSQLANLIQSFVEALSERGFDPRRAPLDIPEETLQQVTQKVVEMTDQAGEAGLKALSLLTAAATAGLERLAAMDAAAFEQSRPGRIFAEFARRAAAGRRSAWL
jgi:hypothetical protein